MRIATWNLDHASNGSRPIELQIQKIISVSADIIILTETCDEVNLLPYGYSYSHFSESNSYHKYCSAIWSKYPIVRAIKTYDPETATCAEIASPLGKVIIYGTIITYFGDKGKDGTSPFWHEHHKAINDHGSDWKIIFSDENVCRLPLIVAGDFNQPRDGSKYNKSKDGQNISMLDEALMMNHLTCLTSEDFGLAGKLNADPKKGYIRSNIDHICMTTNAFSVDSVNAWNHFTEDNIYMSDHNGVYVDLSTNSLQIPE